MIRMWSSILASNFADGMRGKGIAQTGLMYLISVSVLSIVGALLWSIGGQSFFLRWIVVAGFAQLLCELAICRWIGYLLPEFRVMSSELFGMLRNQIRLSNLHRAQAAKFRANYAELKLRLAEEIPELEELSLAYENTTITLMEFDDVRARVLSAWYNVTDALGHQHLELSTALTQPAGMSLMKEVEEFVVLANQMSSHTQQMRVLIHTIHGKIPNAPHSKEFDRLKRRLPNLAEEAEREQLWAQTSMSMLLHIGAGALVSE